MRKKAWTWLLAVVLMVAVAWIIYEPYAIAPEFHQSDIQSGQVIDNQNLMDKVTLLNFWYPSCPGCVNEMPKLSALSRQYQQDDGFQIIGIALNHNTLKEVKTYQTMQKIPFVLTYDANNTAANAFGVTLAPMTFVINHEGRIVKNYLGEPDWHELNELITKLLQSKQAKKP